MFTTHENQPFQKFGSSRPNSSTLNKGVGSGNVLAEVKPPLRAVLRNRVHPTKSMTKTEHRREVDRNVKLEAAKLREMSKTSGDQRIGRLYRATKTALAKARAHQFCGQSVVVRACGGCGEARPGTAVPPPDDVMMRCDMECCGYCGRYKADILFHKLSSKIAAMQLSKNFDLVMITITEHSSPTDPAEYTVARLEERIRALRHGIKALWDTKRFLGEELEGRLKFGAPISTGMFEREELSDNGALHAHVIYYGPRREKNHVQSILKRAWPAAGFVDFKYIATTRQLALYQASHDKPEEQLTEEERRINSSIREVSKYSVKASSPFDEGHLAGEKRWKIDPALAAKYEIATYSQRLTEWRGILRATVKVEAQLELQAQAEKQTTYQLIEQDEAVACSSCGVVGDWEWRPMPISEYVKGCHARGLKAFPRSRWTPPVDDRGS